MAGDTTTFEGYAKELYPIKDIMDMEQRLTGLLNKVDRDPSLEFSMVNTSAGVGGTFKFPVYASTPHGQKMINEREAIPQSTASNVIQGVGTLKEYVGVLDFTKRALALGKSDKAAFANVKIAEAEQLIENAHKYFNRQMATGTGVGTITLVSGVQSGVAAGTMFNVDDASHFQIGQVLDFWSSSGATKQLADAVVTDIDFLSATNQIALDVALTCDDNAIICLAGVRDNMSTDGKEFTSIEMCVDDGSDSAVFQGITRTGAGEVPNYRGIVKSAGGAALSLSMINQLIARSMRVGGIKFEQLKDVYWCISPEQWTAYVALTQAQYRYGPSDSPDGNKQYANGPQILGKEVVVDTDVSRSSLYIIKKDAIGRAVQTELGFDKELGGSEMKWLSGYPMGVQILYSLQNMFCRNPHGMAAIEGLATVTV